MNPGDVVLISLDEQIAITDADFRDSGLHRTSAIRLQLRVRRVMATRTVRRLPENGSGHE